jgi:nitrite reductase/ring-hydroxylating ferredoxin subunit
MKREDYRRVAGVSELADGRGKKLQIGDQEIALWRVNGRFYAISNVCAHQHIAALHLGTLNELKISCPMHGWTYSLETGKTDSGEGQVRVFGVIVEGDDVYVEVPKAAW